MWAEGPSIFAALDVPLEGRSNIARSQISCRFFFGKYRVMTSSALHRRGFKWALRELGSSGGKVRPDHSS
jgi:hypothetical protein